MKSFQQKDAYEHAWQWFTLHASQRMDLINYFVVATAFLATAYATALQGEMPLVSAAVAILGIVMSICFQLVETRTRELIRLGERALAVIESTIAVDTGVREVQFIRGGAKSARPMSSYRIVIRLLHFSALLFFVASLANAIWKL